MTSRLTKILIGCITTLLLLSLFGGAGNALEIIAVSVICTVGVGLALWLLLWWGIGVIVVQLISAVIKAYKKSTGHQVEEKTILSSSKEALVNYIKQARNKGLNDDNISLILKNNGWGENAVKEAFSYIESQVAK